MEFADTGMSLFRYRMGAGGNRLSISDFLEDAPQEVIDDVVRYAL